MFMQNAKMHNGHDIISDNMLTALFLKVASVLARYQAYWQINPMSCQKLPWQAALNDHLQALSDAELVALEHSPDRQLAMFSSYFPELNGVPLLWQASHDTTDDVWPFWLTNGISGRKLTQIAQFCHFIPHTSLPIIEWCAGKGHLGRLLAAARQSDVTSVEWQPQLCRDGQQLAKQHALPQRFVQADVLQGEVESLLQPQQHLLALHACGQLHVRMLQLAVRKGCQRLQVAPCCYHLMTSSEYVPLSQQGKQQPMRLHREQLKLAVQGQVTGGERVARLRQTEVSWRLGYEALRQYYGASDVYQPVPSLPKSWFSGEFADFARHAASLHRLALPETVEWAAFHAIGQARYRTVQQIDTIRHLFRRPLELYLVLDRALFLQEHGYHVSVQAFCDYTVTPRNLMLTAQRVT